jgi:uncharacterized protein
MLMRYFKNSLIFAVLGLLCALAAGYWSSGHWLGALNIGFLTLVLAVLEVALSFDNAVVNASVLKGMTPLWQRRFLTWGIVIAVFGMRVILPVALVSMIAKISPVEALSMAIWQPDEYSTRMHESQIILAGFGGAFLLMVALKYFFDVNKDVHWLQLIEKPLVKIGKMESVEIAIALLALYGFSRFLDPTRGLEFLLSGLFGLIIFVAVDGVAGLMKSENAAHQGNKLVAQAGLGSFLYLEILDSSFSFDGVIGAFAITNNLLIIAVGLGIGAMFVRSMTIMLVEKETLNKYRYLEHGAFYAIGSLAILLFLEPFLQIPEYITGLSGAGFIGLSFWSSLRAKS